MSVMDNNEINITDQRKGEVELGKFCESSSQKPKQFGGGTRKPKKLIYFSDGRTMERDEDDSKDDNAFENVEKCCSRSNVESLESTPHLTFEVDPSKMTWPEWIKHYSNKGGSTVMGGLENAGESLAYFFGITTPKYQHEIDEYNHMVAKKKADAAEAKAWSATNPSFVPITEYPIQSYRLEERNNV